MKNSKLLRFILLVGDENANYFSGISKLSQYVIFDSKKPLTINQIITKIEETFSLTFSSKELEEMFARDKKKKFLLNVDKGANKTVSLSDFAAQEIIDLENKENKVDYISKKFLENNADTLYSLNCSNVNFIKECLIKLFYETFNSNISQLQLFLNNNYEKAIKQIKLNEKEKHISILFFQWDDEEKNILVERSGEFRQPCCSI